MPTTSPDREDSDELLVIRGIAKRYRPDAPEVLSGINMSQVRGEFISLLGPSGCGKTTLLRIVAGLDNPSSGEVFLEGKPSLRPSYDKAIVFQQFSLFPWRSALRNAEYGLEMRGVSRKERQETAMSYLELVGLRDFAHHKPKELSGGMQQRVGIARALAVQPKLLLMDEPFGALDAMTREDLQIQLAEIALRLKMSTLFVTHSIDEALYLSDRIVVLNGHPSGIVGEFVVKADRPRTRADLLVTPEIVHMRQEIMSLLKRTEAG